jgi:hypothetical protein
MSPHGVSRQLNGSSSGMVSDRACGVCSITHTGGEVSGFALSISPRLTTWLLVKLDDDQRAPWAVIDGGGLRPSL